MTRIYEKIMPVINRDIVGKNTLNVPIFFVRLPIAGDTKPNISLAIIGIEPIIPINSET